MEEFVYLIFTIAVELPIALLFLNFEDWRRVCLAVIGVNMVSHPIIWWLLFTQNINWFVAEGGVAVFESLVLMVVFPKRRLLAVSVGILMNIVTALIGYLIS